MGIETGDFYEDDEPIADVLAAWERGSGGRIVEPRRGVNVVLDLNGGHVAPFGRTVRGINVLLTPDRPVVAVR